MSERLLLVLGGNGALGQAVIRQFRKLPQWTAASVDFKSNGNADQNILLRPDQSWDKHAEHVIQWVKTQAPKEAESVHAIISVAGSWCGAAVGSPEFHDSVQRMYRANAEPSFLGSCPLSACQAASVTETAHLAARTLAPRGLLAFTGAAGVALMQPTPGMLAYGTAKAAVSHIHRSMSAPGTLPKDAKCVLIAPETIDTPANRGAMPDADHSSWTPPSDIAARLSAWAQGEERVHNGDAYVIATRKGATEFRKVHIDAQK